jgi:hypothetical protein
LAGGFSHCGFAGERRREKSRLAMSIRSTS